MNNHKSSNETSNGTSESAEKKNPVSQGLTGFQSGERGIRTPGTSRYGSFQDYCNRPLYHLSSMSKWCHQESNRGHKDFQSFALPTELWHLLIYVCRTNTLTSNQRYKANAYFILWCHQESNRGHKDFQSFALPTELWHRIFYKYIFRPFASCAVTQASNRGHKAI